MAIIVNEKDDALLETVDDIKKSAIVNMLLFFKTCHVRLTIHSLMKVFPITDSWYGCQILKFQEIFCSYNGIFK